MKVDLDSLVRQGSADGSPSAIAVQLEALKKEQRDRIKSFVNLGEETPSNQFQLRSSRCLPDRRRTDQSIECLIVRKYFVFTVLIFLFFCLLC